MPESRIEIPRSPTYKHGEGNGVDEMPCVVCGRAVKDGHGYYLYVVDGGGVAALPGTEDPNDSGFLGAYPVGSNCVRKYPQLKPYVLKGPDAC